MPSGPAIGLLQMLKSAERKGSLAPAEKVAVERRMAEDLARWSNVSAR